MNGEVSEDEVRELEKSVIIKKSIDYLKERSEHLKYIRRSPRRYDQVQSKVARCIEVQKSVSRK